MAYRFLRFVFVSGRWDVVQRNLTLFMVGRYPRDELWRIGVGLCAIAAYGGVLAGYVQRMRQITGRETESPPLGRRLLDLAVRIWPLILGVAVLLGLAETPGPAVLTILVIVVRRRRPRRRSVLDAPVAAADRRRRHRSCPCSSCGS